MPDDAVGEARALLTTGEAMLRRGQAKPAILKLQGATTQLANVLAWALDAEESRSLHERLAAVVEIVVRGLQ